MGPVTIFDKSALQALSMDESVWLDAFTMGNVTPLFYVETLADLEKSVKAGSTPEKVVGMLAHKTGFHAVPNVYHRSIMLAELAGEPPIPMDGRPVIGGGVPRLNDDGTTAIHFDEFPEAAALNRWQNGEFEEIERAAAKQWRADLAAQNTEEQIQLVKNILPISVKISNLVQLKEFIDKFCETTDRHVLQLVLQLLDVPERGRPIIMQRWLDAGSPSLEKFAPYTTHVFKVDLLYYLGMLRGFISDVRKSNKADLAYLYYLPFSMVFLSGDKLHASTVPLFLRPDQSFVKLDEIEPALQEIDAHYDALPDEVKALGIMRIAGYPPAHMDNVITQLWNKHMRPDWREISKQEEAGRFKPREEEPEDKDFIKEINKKHDTAVDLPDGMEVPSVDDVQHVMLKRKMPVQKGKWRMISKDVEEKIKESNVDE